MTFEICKTGIQGLEKMSLVDWPGKIVAVAFLGGCDFRCPFCHNSSLIPIPRSSSCDEDPALSSPWPDGSMAVKDFMDFLQRRKGLLDGVCISGGEPLLRTDIEDLLDDIHAVGLPVKIDTNGNHPEVLRSVIENRLADHVAMDVKNSREKYSSTAGVPVDLSRIDQSISLLMEGSIPYEFRTTVVEQFHEPEDIENVCRWIEGAENYYIQSFVPKESVLCPSLTPPSEDMLGHFLAMARVYVKNAALRGI